MTYIPNYTGHGWAGAKYAETQNLDIAEIAKLVRKDIKEQFPELKTSVRIERYAGGQSMSVHVIESPEPLKNPHYDADFVWKLRTGMITGWSAEDELKREYLTPRGKTVEEGLKLITNDYRQNDSDGMIDYFHTNFYAHISLDC